jgi:hypothetical protein
MIHRLWGLKQQINEVKVRMVWAELPYPMEVIQSKIIDCRPLVVHR